MGAARGAATSTGPDGENSPPLGIPPSAPVDDPRINGLRYGDNSNNDNDYSNNDKDYSNNDNSSNSIV